MALTGKTVLGGKQFGIVNYDVVTVRNEHYIMKLIRETGLDRILPVGQETDQAYMLRVHAAVVDTLKLPELLAGYLLPLGKTETDWSEAMAAETAAFIAGLQDAEDKQTIHGLGLSVVFDFWKAGIDSLRASQSALSPLTTPAATGRSGQPAGH